MPAGGEGYRFTSEASQDGPPLNEGQGGDHIQDAYKTLGAEGG